MSKHTKGKWIINRGSGWFSVIAETPICNLTDFNGKIFTEIEETEANAALIASAPEMLEALKKALTCQSIDSNVRKLLQQAIAKAEGRAER